MQNRNTKLLQPSSSLHLNTFTEKEKETENTKYS